MVGRRFIHKFTGEVATVLAADADIVRLSAGPAVTPAWVFAELVKLGHYVEVAS
jgi:hypothetical protein